MSVIEYELNPARNRQKISVPIAGGSAIEIECPKREELLTHPAYPRQAVRGIMALLEGSIQLEAGLSEVATILGVSKQRANELRRSKNKLPEPIVQSKATPVWDTRDVLEYALTRNRKPGRPTK